MNKERFLSVYFLIFTLLIAGAALLFPANNWDVIGYVASAMSLEIKDETELHAYVFDGLRRAVPAQAYADFVRSAYQETVSKDPQSLRQIRSWYQIRPAYVIPIYLLERAGVNPFLATHLLAVTAVFCGLWIFFLAVRERIDFYLMLILPLFVILLGVFEVSRLSTPDGLVFLAIALIFFFLERDHWVVFLILPLSLLVRTDLIIFVLLILAYIFVTNRRRRVWAGLVFVLAVGLYWAINQYYGNYGYATLFWTTFVENLAYPAEADVALTFAHYARAFAEGLLGILYFKEFLVYVTFLGLALLLFYRMGVKGQPARRALREPLAIALIALASVIVHFLIFPAMWPRFFSGQYFIGAVVFLMVVSAALEGAGEPTV